MKPNSINNNTQGLYTLKSNSLNYNNQPFIAGSDEEAMYQIRAALKKEGSFLNETKEDLSIYRIGTWSSRDKAIVDDKEYKIKELAEL